MKYCASCGSQIEDKAKFCPHCGMKTQQTNYKKRTEEYVGKVIKCPSCGAELSSLTAICPSCGHEINSSKISDSLQSFINQIDDCDRRIAYSSEKPKTGWSSWGKWKKFGWVLLNLYLACIPLVIYLLRPLWATDKTVKLTADEKHKAVVIKNYPFPEDRGSILEALLFIKSKVAFLVDEKVNANVLYWSKLWTKKAEHLYHKAEMMFPGDSIANNAYKEIQKNNAKIKKTIKIRLLLTVALVIGFVIFVAVRSGAIDIIRNFNEPLVWSESELAKTIPEIESKSGEIKYDNDENYWLEIYSFTDSEYDDYIDECKKKGYTIENKKDSISYEAYNELGYHLQLRHYNSSNDLTIRVEAPIEMNKIKWPKSKIAELLPVPKSTYGKIEWEADYGFVIYLGNITKNEYKDYIDACIDKGFIEDYKRGDDYFHAKNDDGYKVDIDYRGFDTMFLRIDEP